MARRNRPTIILAVDPNMLDEVDAYINEHEGLDRSQVVNDALRIWYERILQEALARQHSAPKSPEEPEERAAWKRIRAAKLARQTPKGIER
jgi:hypothetical protein